MGATEFVPLDKVALLAGSLDVVINTVNRPTGRNEELVACLVPNGVFCFVGGPSGKLDITTINIVGRQRVVCGSCIGSRQDMIEMLNFCAIHDIKPMVEMFKMSDVHTALDHIRKGKPRYRIVLEMDSVV